jgi:hypothetical protein
VISRSTDIRSALRSRQRGFVLDPYRFGSAGGGGGHRHWRVAGIVTSSTLLEISELQFLAGGSPVSGTMSASHAFDAGSIGNLSDGNLSTNVYRATIPIGFRLKWDFGSAQTVDAVREGQYNEPSEYAVGFSLWRSSDDISWSRQAAISGLTPPGNFTISGDIDVSAGGSTAYRYWSIANVDVNGGSNLDISEWHLRSGGALLSTTPTCSHAPSGGSLASLVDNGTGARIQWNGTIAESVAFWIAIDAGSAADVTQIKIGGFDNSGRYPSSLVLEYSDDTTPVNWTRYGSASGLSYPGNNTLSGAISFS